jgi:nucleoside-diphosphate-sugar epimerase
MIVYIVGHKGWIGKMYIELLKKKNIHYIFSDYRGESEDIKKDILKNNVTHILCTMGRTHGNRDGKTYTTIDYLQDNSVLGKNINDNLFVPLSLALFAKLNNIHFTYMGTGCIYSYDNNHDTVTGFMDEEKPNFYGSNYSVVKGFTNELMKYTDALVLKIRMPIVGYHHPRNFITKITKYEKICSIPNSMTVLDEMIPISIEMMENSETGLYNFTNPGTISHNEILEMYKKYIDPMFIWKNFTIDEQDNILESKRSNNYLDTKKLESKYNVKNINKSIYDLFINNFK